ncbi:hypothetical protein GQ457_06G015870 [Hibiscus cannabinus]
MSEDTRDDLSPHMTDLLLEFASIFAEPHDLPPIRENDHAIHLDPLAKPVNVRPYRYPYFEKTEVERQVQIMLDNHLTRRSTSSFSSPVLLVKKKGWDIAFLCGLQSFECCHRYHQICVKELDVHKTAFRTHEGHYEFLVMPFGLTNAPSTFQATMNVMFKPYLRKSVLIFNDDILIYSATWADHCHHVRLVLQCLQDHRFVAKRSKCTFGRTSVEYLGHVVSSDGLQVDPGKVVAIHLWPIPTTVKEVRSFLGMASYYHKFIQGFGSIASSISDMLRKDVPFLWTVEAQAAMDHLKSCFCIAPVLGLPNFELPFQVETNASGTGVGVVLTQAGRLLAFFSQKLCPCMQHASTYSKEMFVITQAVAKWRQYLVGRQFVIVTDQRSLRELNQQTIQTPEQQRWLSKLVGYDFDIQYRPRKLNNVADALSRELENVLSNNKEVIFVVIDRFTKYRHLFALPHQFDSVLVAQVLHQGVIKLHGIPRTIVSDRDCIFVTDMWTELAKLQGSELCFSSAYHPQSDGQTEALSHCLEMYLCCMVAYDPRQWCKYFPWAEYWYNTAYHSSVGMTPFRALYGRDPPTILSYVEGGSHHDQLAQELLDRDVVLKELKHNLEAAHNRMML